MAMHNVVPTQMEKAIEIKEAEHGKKMFIERFAKVCIKAKLTNEKADQVLKVLVESVNDEDVQDIAGFKKNMDNRLKEIGIHSKSKRKKLARESYRLAERYLR